MKQHKWHKEIKAWAAGEAIEFNLGYGWHKWTYVFEPLWSMSEYKYRIKVQPVEPQLDSNEYKIQHLMDLYAALGVKFGDDPFEIIKQLKQQHSAGG